ncbi:MAG TPA: DUF2845 domain-containing protein [Steroidobacteraceae bacterium]|jgi:hypothetical protein
MNHGPMKLLAIVMLLTASCVGTAHADNFRCGKWIASPDLSVAELLAKCGEPASRESRTEDVMSRNFNTGLMYKSGEQTVEIWTYDRGANAPPMIVTIVEGRIKSIERKKPA